MIKQRSSFSIEIIMGILIFVILAFIFVKVLSFIYNESDESKARDSFSKLSSMIELVCSNDKEVSSTIYIPPGYDIVFGSSEIKLVKFKQLSYKYIYAGYDDGTGIKYYNDCASGKYCNPFDLDKYIDVCKPMSDSDESKVCGFAKIQYDIELENFRFSCDIQLEVSNDFRNYVYGIFITSYYQRSLDPTAPNTCISDISYENSVKILYSFKSMEYSTGALSAKTERISNTCVYTNSPSEIDIRNYRLSFNELGEGLTVVVKVFKSGSIVKVQIEKAS